jgi:hypothetical protein
MRICLTLASNAHFAALPLPHDATAAQATRPSLACKNQYFLATALSLGQSRYYRKQGSVFWLPRSLSSPRAAPVSSTNAV